MRRRGRPATSGVAAVAASTAATIRRAGLATVAAVTALFSLPAPAADAIDRAQLVPLSQSVLRVEAVSGGRLHVGTGITVAPGVVLTNCHVVLGAREVRVVKRAALWSVDGVHVDADHDLCYLRAPRWTGRPILIAGADAARLHQPVAALGFTGGAELSVSDGQILDLHRHDQARIIRTDAGFSSGASGGALVDGGGRLLGILTFRLPGRGDRFYALPADWIRPFLEQADPQWDPLPADPTAARPAGAPVRAFWQRGPGELPYFMQAEALELSGRWLDLADLADRWQAVDPQSAEPWLAKGKAMRAMDRPEAAVRALRRAVRLAEENVDAWYELATTSLAIGDGRAAELARQRLRGLDPVLAGRLDEQIQPLSGSRP